MASQTLSSLPFRHCMLFPYLVDAKSSRAVGSYPNVYRNGTTPTLAKETLFMIKINVMYNAYFAWKESI